MARLHALGHRTARMALWGSMLVSALLLAIAGGLWLWSGSSTSLASAVDQLARWLPANQTLEATEVSGTLRGGGHIGWLRWSRGDLSVQAREVSIGWSLRPLLDGELRLSQVAVNHLRIEDRSTSTRPATAPTALALPLRVDMPFTVATLEWVGTPSLSATGLAGRYVFDSYNHRLYEGQLHISSGNYQIQGSLQAQAPMALSVLVDGTAQTTLPSSQQPLQLQAHASVSGTLSGPDATLALQADLSPQHEPPHPRSRPPSLVNGAATMQASVSARLQPWQAQPLAQAQARWQALDLAALWPQAPHTRLSGEATVEPAGAGWQGTLVLDNHLSGPLNAQRVPLEHLVARMAYTQGRWTIASLRARGAGGRLEGVGQHSAQPNSPPTTDAPWQGNATIHGLHTAALDSRLADTVLGGQLRAQHTALGIAFQVDLQASQGQATPRSEGQAAQRTLDGLHLKALQAQGQWAAPVLTLTALAVHTDDAQLQGQATLDTASLATQGHLALTLPGAQVTLNGHLSSTRGQGEWNVQVADAARAARWSARLPGIPELLGRSALDGSATLTGRWQGGWQHQGQALQIQASARVPRLSGHPVGQPTAQAWQLRQAQANLTGTLRNLTLSTQGQADIGTLLHTWQAQAHGSRLGNGDWQAQLDSAQLRTLGGANPGPWLLQLRDSMTVQWKQSSTQRSLQTSTGAVRLTGPLPGTALVSWQPLQWTQRGTDRQARTQWRTQGRITDLPLDWLTLLGQTQVANLGLHGDLLLGGQWDAASSDTLRLRATLERTSGDLQLPSDTAGASPTSAGIRQARITLSAEGEQFDASLLWDSARAGQAQADVHTRLQRQDGNWTWPAHAPLRGNVHAQLPSVGVWSVLAPPGWRLRGTLDADAVLSGTRSAPQWRGQLSAQDLAVRSVVDGIDFSQGSLRATLQGQRLEIQTFTLRGAGAGAGAGTGAGSGGLLSITGFVQWPTANDTAQHLRMELQASAQALRTSARADRRLVLSGLLSASLVDTALAIRGTLKADQALFVLPDDTAPQLGTDVVVRTPQARPFAAPSATTPSTASAPRQTPGRVGARVNPDVAVTLDLGSDFQVRGRGLATRLAGRLELRSSGPNLQPRLVGTLSTVHGTYKAYGQQLDIEQGVLRFSGAYDNPALDILALRPHLQQRVGVQISGTALSPVVRLYADPDLPESEKLAWLVLGRAGANGGAEAAMLQQAALALLGGPGQGRPSSVAEVFGLDELSVRNGASGLDDDTGTASSTVTVGKRLSRDFYLAYERSLAGTMGTLSIFYDLSRRFTLRAQTGQQSAVDLIFTLRFD